MDEKIKRKAFEEFNEIVMKFNKKYGSGYWTTFSSCCCCGGVIVTFAEHDSKCTVYNMVKQEKEIKGNQ